MSKLKVVDLTFSYSLSHFYFYFLFYFSVSIFRTKVRVRSDKIMLSHKLVIVIVTSYKTYRRT